MSALEQIDVVIDQATQFLVEQQRSDGSWPGQTFGGADSTAVWFITQRLFLGTNHPQLIDAIQHLRHIQQDDGGFLPYPGATNSNLRTTAIVCAMLTHSAEPKAKDVLDKALIFCQHQGGFDSLDQQAKAYLGISGILSKEDFVCPTVLFRLMPGFDRFVGRRFAEFPAIAANSLPPTLVGICRGAGALSQGWNVFNRIAANRFIRYFRKHQNPSGDWGGVMEPSCWVLIALYYLGVDMSNPMVLRALVRLNHWLEETPTGVQVVPFKAEVWNTSLVLRAQLMQGATVSDPAVGRGLAYLIREQGLINERLDWQNPRSGQPRFGGWAFQAGNPLGSDPDSTSAVMYTLGLAQQAAIAHGQEISSLSTAIDVGKRWLLGMQNPDGGWPSFTWGQKSKSPGPLYTKPMVEPKGLLQQFRFFMNPPLELADPALEDETGRILNALIAINMTPSDKPVMDAIAFLRSQVGDNGVWWGRWEVNYLTATGYILNGLGDAEVDSSQDWVSRAVHWVLSKQNSDGGWGETPQSYFDPALAGIGESNPVVTGKVLTGLASIQRTNLAPVQSALDRGVHYLLTTQEAGRWETDFAVGVVLPPDVLYTNPLFSQYVCLEALLSYRRFVLRAGA